MNEYIVERFNDLTQQKSWKTEQECDAVIATISGLIVNGLADRIDKVKLVETGEYTIAVTTRKGGNSMLLFHWVQMKLWSLLGDATTESFDFDTNVAHLMEDVDFWLNNPHEFIEPKVAEPTVEELEREAAEYESFLEEKRYKNSQATEQLK